MGNQKEKYPGEFQQSPKNKYLREYQEYITQKEKDMQLLRDLNIPKDQRRLF